MNSITYLLLLSQLASTILPSSSIPMGSFPVQLSAISTSVELFVELNHGIRYFIIHKVGGTSFLRCFHFVLAQSDEIVIVAFHATRKNVIFSVAYVEMSENLRDLIFH